MNKESPGVMTKEFSLLNGKKAGKSTGSQGLRAWGKSRSSDWYWDKEEETEVLGYCHSLFVSEMRLII